MCRGFFCFSTSTSGVSCVQFPLFPVCFAVSIPCAQTVKTSPMWCMGYHNLLPILRESLMMSICDLLSSLFCHSLHLITLVGKFASCTLDRKKCLDVWNLTKRRVCLSGCSFLSLHFSSDISSDSRRRYSR